MYFLMALLLIIPTLSLAQVTKIDDQTFQETVILNIAVDDVQSQIAVLDKRDEQYQAALDADVIKRKMLVDKLNAASKAGVSQATDAISDDGQ